MVSYPERFVRRTYGRALMRVAGAVLCLGTAVEAQSPSKADQVLDRAVAAHGAVGTLRATFEQSISNPLTGSTVKALGELQQQPPKLLAVNFTEPKGDRIVSDGQSLWIYLPSSMPGQAMRLPLGASGAAMGGVDLLGQFFEKPRARYTVGDVGSAQLDGRKVYAITLTPKAAGAPFQKATLWLDDETGYVRQFETLDGSGLVRKVRMLKFRPGAAPDDGAFRFTLPKGVRLIEQPGMS